MIVKWSRFLLDFTMMLLLFFFIQLLNEFRLASNWVPADHLALLGFSRFGFILCHLEKKKKLNWHIRVKIFNAFSSSAWSRWSTFWWLTHGMKYNVFNVRLETKLKTCKFYFSEFRFSADFKKDNKKIVQNVYKLLRSQQKKLAVDRKDHKSVVKLWFRRACTWWRNLYWKQISKRDLRRNI